MKPTDHSEYAVTIEVRVSKRGKVRSQTITQMAISTPADTLAEADEVAAPFRKQMTRAVTRNRKPTNWFDGGYLGYGHCPFMQAMNGKTYNCARPHGHEGNHSHE